MGRFGEAWSALFANKKYSQSEKQRLSKLCDLAKFQDDYHVDIFKQFELEKPIKDEVLSKDKFDLTAFVQIGSHIFNAETKQVATELDGYILNPSKNSYRVNKIVAAVLYSLVTKKLFLGRYDSPSEIEKRITEVQNTQDWICAIISSQNPNVIDDKEFIGILESVNKSLDKIDEILEAKIEELERQDILSGFEGSMQIKAVIDNVIEYLSSLSIVGGGFSTSKLFQDATREGSDSQKFLTGTNIGIEILTHLLSLGNVQRLFSVDTDIRSIHSLTGNADSKIEIGDIWGDRSRKEIILNLLQLLDSFATSALTSDLIKKSFSGVVGNAGILGPNKESFLRFFGISSDGLAKLRVLLKSLHDNALKLDSISHTKKTQLRRLHRVCDKIITETAKSFDKVVAGIHEAPPVQKLLEQFKERMKSIEDGINLFQTCILPLLPDDTRVRYALVNSSRLAIGCGETSSARSQATETRLIELNQQRNRIHTHVSDYMTNIARLYIGGPTDKPLVLMENGPFIEGAKTEIIKTIAEQRRKNALTVRSPGDTTLSDQIFEEDKIRGLKIVGVATTQLVVPSVVGVGVGVGLHYSSLVAISGASAVAPWGALAGATAGLLVVIAIGSFACYRVSQLSEAEREGRSRFSLWTREFGNCFTFSRPHEHRKKLYYRLCSWNNCLDDCVGKLLETAKRGKNRSKMEFAIKALEAVLYYKPNQDRALLDEFNPKDDEHSILDQAIKLRYAFLRLIRDNKVCFIEGIETTGTKTEIEEELAPNYSFGVGEKDKDVIDAARVVFISIICSAIEHLKREKDLCPSSIVTDQVVEENNVQMNRGN